MQADPVEEWRRLSALYSQMGDIEIQELADQINDLVPTAQDVLRDELKKRGIKDLHGSSNTSVSDRSTSFVSDRPAAVHQEPPNYRNEFSELLDDDDRERDYTWKTPVCECESLEEARYRGEMLRRAGIESWVDNRRLLLVAADQLERARAIALLPISQEIIDEDRELRSAWAGYELPTCPHCGAPDPTLESIEPSNSWLCESCEHTWSDPLIERESK